MPSVDTGTEYLYHKINRPMAELNFAQFIDGIVAFRNEYSGHLWVEVMLIERLNDSEEALRDLATVLERIRPDEVHLNSPTRAPCEPWVKSVDEGVFVRAQRILGVVARIVRPRDGAFVLSGFDNVVDAVVAIVQRHPISEDELISLLNQWTPDHVRESLEKLAQSGKVTVVPRDGRRHWTYVEARYVEEAPARCQPRPSPEEGVLP
jgi:wyosine [tRNA(Phe)-imidazoG37] synthetase (radical SAM superfamily)